MANKAKLRIILKANDTVVVESEDPALWGKVLTAINSPEEQADIPNPDDMGLEEKRPADAGLARFAQSLGISTAQVQGALDPSSEAPYLRLNTHRWESMKKNTPQRGPGSLTPIGLAGTLLALWLRDSGLNIQATQSLASSVLGTVGAIDKNPSRGIKNTKWLQARNGGVIIINPAEISAATAIARSFCTGEWAKK